MRKLMLACCLGALVSAPALANKDMDPADKAEHLQKVLQLNDNQTQQIQQALENSHKQAEALKEKYRISQWDQYKDEKKNLKSDQHDKIGQILNEKQREAWDALREAKEEMHDKKKEKR